MTKLYNYASIIFTITISFFFYSCEKEITIDLNSSEPKYVIEGLVELNTFGYVDITMSKDYNSDGTFPPVDGALVELSDDNGKKEILTQNSSGRYVAKTIRGEKGRTYSLKININDQTFTSTSKMPEFVKIDSMFMYYIPAFEASYPMMTFQDPGKQTNYYRNRVYINGKRMDLGGDVIDNKDRQGRVIDRIMYVDTDDLQDEKIQTGDTITAELMCIDKGAFDFFDSLSRMSMSQTNPTSNITGGALGYFSAYTLDSITIIAKVEK